MKTISTYQVYEYLCEKFPDLKDVLKNGFIDKHENKCVGVFLAPSTRNLPNIALGGPDCTTVKMLPVNILLHWTKNQKDCSEKANEIFDALLCQDANFTVGDTKYVYIELLDPCPIGLDRDERGICEQSIRANFYYYC